MSIPYQGLTLGQRKTAKQRERKKIRLKGFDRKLGSGFGYLLAVNVYGRRISDCRYEAKPTHVDLSAEADGVALVRQVSFCR